MSVLLISVTWIMWLFASWGVGIFLAPFFIPGMSAKFRERAQFGIWIGVLALVVLTVVLNFFVPNSGNTSKWIAFAWILCGILLLGRWLVLERARLLVASQRIMSKHNLPSLLVVVMLFGSGIFAAWFAAAEPMDYDAGLYRMGVINYAAEYPAIPGLANLHSRFGYNSALGPLASFVGNGIWTGNEFRIISGFFYAVLVLDICLRVLVPRRRTPGDFLIVLGWAFVTWVVLDDSGRWMASPSQDLISLIAGLAAFAYFVDFIYPNSCRPWLASSTIFAASVSAAIRPIGWVLVLTMLLIIFVVITRPRQRRKFDLRASLFLLPTLISIMVLCIVIVTRDTIISGWLLFPLSSFPMPVDWRTADPSGDTLAISWWARAPGMTVDQAQAKDWIGPWVESFAMSRESVFFIAALCIGLCPLIWAKGRHAWQKALIPIAISLVPAVVVSVIWFITAPDLRFGWTGLVSLVGIPVAFLLTEGAYPRGIYQGIFFLLVALGVGTNWRDGHFEQRGNPTTPQVLDFANVELSVWLGPPNEVRVIEGQLADGTPIIHPRYGENCYMVFPLCLPPGAGNTVERRGNSIVDGFRVSQNIATDGD